MSGNSVVTLDVYHSALNRCMDTGHKNIFDVCGSSCLKITIVSILT